MKRTTLALAALAILVFASVALAACGGSDDNGGSDDQDQITQAITAAATSGDPATCTKYQTLKFTEQTTGAQGQAAIQSCQKDATNTAADTIDVTDIQVDGDSATAKGKATGSIFDGQTLKVALVKEDDQWKLDDFQGFENLNKDAMAAAFTQQLKAEGDPPQAIDCLTKQFQSASDDVIEGTFVDSDTQAEQQLFGPCAKYFKQG
jgi:hypothetical protein